MKIHEKGRLFQKPFLFRVQEKVEESVFCMGERMDKKLLPKGFFSKNPLKKMSAAQIAYFSMDIAFDEEIHEVIFDQIAEDIDIERMEKIQSEAEKISQLKSGEQIVRFMRTEYDIINRWKLCQKALSMQEEVVPLMLQRLRTNKQDMFIESSIQILAYCEPVYLEQLKAMYHEIRNPYTQSMACLVFGMRHEEDTLQLLLEEYERFKKEYVEEDFSQGPLLAINILYGKA